MRVGLEAARGEEAGGDRDAAKIRRATRSPRAARGREEDEERRRPECVGRAAGWRWRGDGRRKREREEEPPNTRREYGRRSGERLRAGGGGSSRVPERLWRR
jgi:hypothetical protein